MCKICIFAGTTEARRLVELLSTQPVSVTACVATEYGETLLPEGGNVCLLYTSPSPRDRTRSRMPSSA